MNNRFYGFYFIFMTVILLLHILFFQGIYIKKDILGEKYAAK